MYVNIIVPIVTQIFAQLLKAQGVRGGGNKGGDCLFVVVLRDNTLVSDTSKFELFTSFEHRRIRGNNADL